MIEEKLNQRLKLVEERLAFLSSEISTRSITTEEIKFVSRSGEVNGFLGNEQNGITFRLGALNKNAASISVDNQGNVKGSVNKVGKPVLAFETDASGWTSVEALESHSRRFRFSISPDGVMSLLMSDDDQHPRFLIQMDDKGEVSMRIVDNNGHNTFEAR